MLHFSTSTALSLNLDIYWQLESPRDPSVSAPHSAGIIDVFIFIYVRVCLHIYTMCMPRVHGDKKGVSDPLELELQMTLNCHLGAGILWKST